MRVSIFLGLLNKEVGIKEGQSILPETLKRNIDAGLTPQGVEHAKNLRPMFKRLMAVKGGSFANWTQDVEVISSPLARALATVFVYFDLL